MSQVWILSRPEVSKKGNVIWECNAGVAAIYMSNNPTARPMDVKAAIVSAATQGKLQSATMLPGTPNRLLYSQINQTPSISAMNGPPIAPFSNAG